MLQSRLLISLCSVLAIAGATACADGPTTPVLERLEIVFRGQLANGDGGFIVMNADGSSRRVLARPTDGIFCPSLSPDGDQLLYATSTTNQIAVLDISTGSESRLTPQGQLLSQCPAWSPDGTKIAFFRGPNTAPAGFGLFIMRADGSDVREVAPDGYAWAGIDWSPDGRWLAVTRADLRLVLVDAATGTTIRVLTPTTIGSQADFSPDGTQIAYTVEDNGAIDVYVSNVDGTNARRLTNSTGYPDLHFAPRWSPDGNLLAYWGFVPDTLPQRNVPGILLMSKSGARVRWAHGAAVYGDQPFWRGAP